MKFSNKKKDDIILEVEGKKYVMTPQELAITNSMLLEALISELSKKGLVDPESLGKTIEEIQSSRTKT